MMSFEAKVRMREYGKDLSNGEKDIVFEMDSNGLVKITIINLNLECCQVGDTCQLCRGESINLYIDELFEHLSKLKAANDIGREPEQKPNPKPFFGMHQFDKLFHSQPHITCQCQSCVTSRY